MFYHFFLEGENIDGDLIVEFFEVETTNEIEALAMAKKVAIAILEDENGGHIDIFNEDGIFVVDVEI